MNRARVLVHMRARLSKDVAKEVVSYTQFPTETAKMFSFEIGRLAQFVSDWVSFRPLLI